MLSAALNRPLPDQSAETLVNVRGSYHLARMESDPLLRDLAPSFAVAQRRLALRASDYAAAQIGLMTALGRLDAAAPYGEGDLAASRAEFERAKRRAEEAFAVLEAERVRWFRAYRKSFREMQLRIRLGERRCPLPDAESTATFDENDLRPVA